MPEKVTRRSVKKSRGGCARCKSQHLKCDEKRPQCSRCERLTLECPGYSQSIKWSRKHEVVQPTSATDVLDIGMETLQGLPSPHTMQDYEWMEFTMPTSSGSSPVVPDYVDTDANLLLDDIQSSQSSRQLGWPSAESLFETGDHASEAHALQRRAMSSSRTSMLQSLGARTAINTTRFPRSLLHEPYELISYYFKTVPAIYSTFDSHKNPYRSAVSDLFSHSLAVNLAAQSMAAACLVEEHPRFISMGSRLRREALEAVKNEPNHNYDVLLALSMSGPTGNWFQADDLGISSYHAMRDRLEALAHSGSDDKRILFFQEAMVLWELFLAFANSNALRPSIILPPIEPNRLTLKYEPHAWTGIARETLQIVRDIGRLVRGSRLRSLTHKFVSQAQIRQMSVDLTAAHNLESQLLACIYPTESDIASTDDVATPTWHMTTIAELYRYGGLLQLYRVFPDLLSERLRNEQSLNNNTLPGLSDPAVVMITDDQRDEWLTAFAVEAVKLFEPVAAESGTKDFQPIVLVMLASELLCRDEDLQNTTALIFADDTTLSRPFAEVAMMRKFVLDRLTSLLRLIPPKPVRVCLDIVKETWRRMDEGGQSVYWMDVVIENGWETIMA